MKKSTTWLAVSISENGKNYAYAVGVSGSDNLVSFLSGIPGLASANICTSKKSADELSAFWNDCYKKNGTWFCSREEATA